MSKLRNQRGVTLLLLAITIVVLTIVVTVVLINSRTGTDQRALNNMYNDIRILNDKISVYYQKFGELPILKDSDNKPVYLTEDDMKVIDAQDSNFAFNRNPNDHGDYYVIDYTKLDNVNLTYSNYTYVINQTSHTIYFVKDYLTAAPKALSGIEVDGEIYNRLPIDYDTIVGDIQYDIKYLPGEFEEAFDPQTYVQRFGEQTHEFVETENCYVCPDEDYMFVGWRRLEKPEEFYKTKDEIKEIVVKENATYVAQWGTVQQSFRYEFFDVNLNNSWNNSGNYPHTYLIGETSSISGLPKNEYYKSKYINGEEETIEYIKNQKGDIDCKMNIGKSMRDGQETWFEDADIYTFDGWYTSPLFTDESKLEYDEVEGKYKFSNLMPDNTVYAKWVAPAAMIVNDAETGIETFVYKAPNASSALDYNFEYGEDCQTRTFTAPESSYYQIEAWGADGGASLKDNRYGAAGGKGGYSKGVIWLNEGETIYIYLGQKGIDATYRTISPATFNGGGVGTHDNHDDEASGSGGGATDIRLVDGDWDDFESLKSRIMVAGGGGGSSWSRQGGAGGGLSGTSRRSAAPAGTQTTGYAFGIGQNGYGTGDSDGVGGAGGGYYGGTTSDRSDDGEEGAGGSGFISGCEGCDAIAEESTEENIIHTGENIHYSGKFFTKTKLLSGDRLSSDEKNPSTTGNGYVRIKKANELTGTGAQKFVAPVTGVYDITAWGADGGRNRINDVYYSDQGLGGYARGTIFLQENDVLYIYVGKHGADGILTRNGLTEATFNGGGSGIGASDGDDGGGAGGGASDVRLAVGQWDDFESLKSRILVAGGGGGGASVARGFSGISAGCGGGLTAVGNVWRWQNVKIENHSYNATQTYGYKFGIGENGKSIGGAGGSGAGGGYYGGYSSNDSPAAGAGGGSGFIAGLAGCDAIAEESTEDNIIHTGSPIHYSGKNFGSGTLLTGSDLAYLQKNPNPNKNGDGCVKIKYNSQDPVFYVTLNDAIAACPENASDETHIVMLKNVKESNIVDSGKKIKLDLHKHIVEVEKVDNKPYVLNVKSALLHVVGKGQIANNSSTDAYNNVGINIETDGELVLGINNDNKLERNPKIHGTNYALNVEGDGIFRFFDGEIEGGRRLQENPTETAKSVRNGIYGVHGEYNSTTRLWVQYLAEPTKYLAKIGTVLFPTLQEAIDFVEETQDVTRKTIDTRLTSSQWVNDEEYYMEYNADFKKLLPTNTRIKSTNAHSYIKLDLSKEVDDVTLKINAGASCYSSYGGSSYGYAYVTETEKAPTLKNEVGRVFHLAGKTQDRDYVVQLEGGRVYYLHIGFIKDSGREDYNDFFWINKITLNETELFDTIDQINYLEPTTIDIIGDDVVTDFANENNGNGHDISPLKNIVLNLNGRDAKVSEIRNYGKLEVVNHPENGADFNWEKLLGYNTAFSDINIFTNIKGTISSAKLPSTFTNYGELTLTNGTIKEGLTNAYAVTNRGHLILEEDFNEELIDEICGFLMVNHDYLTDLSPECQLIQDLEDLGYTVDEINKIVSMILPRIEDLGDEDKIKAELRNDLKLQIICDTASTGGIKNLYGKTEINSGEINLAANSSTAVYVLGEDNSYLEMNGGTIQTINSATGTTGIYVNERPKVRTYGGIINNYGTSIYVRGDTSYCAPADVVLKDIHIKANEGTGIHCDGYTNVIVDGGLFNKQFGIAHSNDKLTLNGGTLTDIAGQSMVHGGSYRERGTFVMTGGTLYYKGTDTAYYTGAINNLNIYITGGSIIGTRADKGNAITESSGTIKNVHIENFNIGIEIYVYYRDDIYLEKCEMENVTYGVYFAGSYNNSGVCNLVIGNKDGDIKDDPVINANYQAIGCEGTGMKTCYNVHWFDGALKGKVLSEEDWYDIEENCEMEITYDEDTEIYTQRLVRPVTPIIKNMRTGEEYLFIYEALEDEDARAGDLLEIQRDARILYSNEIAEDSEFTIDMKGHTIRALKQFMTNEGTLTLKDSAAEGNKGKLICSSVGVVNSGTFNTDDVVVRFENTQSNVVMINNSGTMNIDNTDFDLYNVRGTFIVNPKDCTTNITNSNISKPANTGATSFTLFNNNGKFNFIDSTSYTDTTNAYILNDTNGEMYIKGGEIYQQKHDYNPDSMVSRGKITFDNTKYTSLGDGLRGGMSGTNIFINSEIRWEATWGLGLSGTTTFEGEDMYFYGPISFSGNATIYDGTFEYGGNASYVPNHITVNDGCTFLMKTGEILYDTYANSYGANNYALVAKGGSNVTIESGRIIHTDCSNIGGAIANEALITIGTKDDEARDLPYIEGGAYGIANGTRNINFYDGIVVGTTAIQTMNIADREENYDVALRTHTENENKQERYLKKADPEAKLKKPGEEEYTEYLKLVDAIAACTTDGELNDIVVLKEISFRATDQIVIPSTVNVKVDLNGFLVNAITENIFENNGTLELCDTSAGNTCSIYSPYQIIKNNIDGHLTLTNVKLYRTTGGPYPNSFWSGIEESTLNSNVVSNEGSFDCTNSAITMEAGALRAIYNKGSMDLDGMTIFSSKNAVIGILNDTAKDVRIKPNIHFSYYDGNWNKTYFININDGEMTICGGVCERLSGYIGKIYSGKFIVEDSTKVVDGETVPDVPIFRGEQISLMHGTVDVRGGQFENVTINMDAQNNAERTIDISGGTFTECGIGGSNTYYGGENDVIRISGTANLMYTPIYNNKGRLYVEGGSMYAVDARSRLFEGGGGTYWTVDNSYCIRNYSTLEDSVTITGGTIEFAGRASNNNYGVYNASTGGIIIGTKGGEVTQIPEIFGATGAIYNPRGKLKFYDGKLTGQNAIAYLVYEEEEGYDVDIAYDANNNEIATLKAINDRFEAEIVETGVQYRSLQEAINAAGFGENIKLLKHIYSSDSETNENGAAFEIDETKNINIEMDGYYIRGYDEVVIENHGILGLTDTSADRKSDIKFLKRYINNYGTSTIDIASIAAQSGGTSSQDNIIFYNEGTLNNANTVVGSGGTYTTYVYNKGKMNLDSLLMSTGYDRTTGIINDGGTEVELNLEINLTYYNSNSGQSATWDIKNINNGEITITGGRYYSPNSCIENDNSTLVVEDGLITYRSAVINRNNAICTVEGGTLEGDLTNDSTSKIVMNDGLWNIHTYYIYFTNEGIIELNGGKILANGTYYNGAKNQENGSIIMSNDAIFEGKLTNQGNATFVMKDDTQLIGGLMNSGTAKFEMQGGTMTYQSSYNYDPNIVIQNSSNVREAIKILSGTINISTAAGTGIYSSTSDTVVFGEDVNEFLEDPLINSKNVGIQIESDGTGSFYFNNGAIIGYKAKSILGSAITPEGLRVEVTSVMNEQDLEKSILGTESTETMVAQIGNFTFATLESAIIACNPGEPTTIKILMSMSIPEQITITVNQNITIDLNGKAISGNIAGGLINNAGTLTILNESGRGSITNYSGDPAITGSGTVTGNY